MHWSSLGHFWTISMGCQFFQDLTHPNLHEPSFCFWEIPWAFRSKRGYISTMMCFSPCCRSLRTKEKAIHRQLYLAMLIQVVIRLILYTDQFITRTQGSSSSSKAGNSTADSGDNATYGASNFVRGIDNTVRTWKHFQFKRPSILALFLCCDAFQVNIFEHL